MSSNQSGEGEIRRAIVEADLIDCMVALPGQLFYSTQIPACLWFHRAEQEEWPISRSRGHVLFIDARKLGPMLDRTQRELQRRREDIRAHQHVLTPGRYVGTGDAEEDTEDFDTRYERLNSILKSQFARARSLQEQILKNLEGLK
jgi:type I restriction enzyme M protein